MPSLGPICRVEQIHRIFKLCGSPPEEYWKKTKLPHATLFKPQHSYESCLQETFESLPESAFNLLETLLSVEPYKRGTASTALASEYFATKPYACEPSSLPKYPPHKEMDSKSHEDLQRKRNISREHRPEAVRHEITCRVREPNVPSKLTAHQEDSQIRANGANKICIKQYLPKPDGGTRQLINMQPIMASNPPNEDQQYKHVSQEKTPGAPKRDGDCIDHKPCDMAKPLMGKQWGELEHPSYHSQDLSKAFYRREAVSSNRRNLGYQDKGDRVEFSGPLLSEAHKVDELLERNERQIRNAGRRTWFKRG